MYDYVLYSVCNFNSIYKTHQNVSLDKISRHFFQRVGRFKLIEGTSGIQTVPAVLQYVNEFNQPTFTDVQLYNIQGEKLVIRYLYRQTILVT